MAARVCGWCGKNVVLRPVVVDVESQWRLSGGMWLATAAYRCDHCSLLNVGALFSDDYQDRPYKSPEAVDRAFIEHSDKVKWQPRWEDKAADFPDVPPAIAEVAVEASACHSAGHFRAAVMLARGVIEATAKKHELTGSLFSKIEALGEARVLSPVTVDAAHAIRDSGNAVAHGDFVDYVIKISEDESLEVIGLMTLVLREAFQTQAQAKRVSAAAAARKKPRG